MRRVSEAGPLGTLLDRVQLVTASVGVALVLLVGEIGGSAGSASADAPQPDEASIAVNPTQIVFEHDGVAVDGYALYVTDEQGVALRVDLGPLRPASDGRIRARLPRLPPGVHTVELAAYNSAGESPRIQGVPARIRITVETARPRPAKSDQEKRERVRETARPQGGFLRRLWRAIVGSEEPLEQQLPAR